MKHCSNKSNIEIVKDYLAGNRPFTQISFHVSDVNKHRREGEKWKDNDGIEWQLKGGRSIRLTKTQSDMIREAIGDRKCKCGLSIKWGNKFDQKLYGKTGMCQDCLADYETKLVIAGVFPLYEYCKVLSNQAGFLKDVLEKLKETIDYFNKNDGTVQLLCNSEGFLEKFHGTNKEKILEDAKRDLIEARKLLKVVMKNKREAKKELKTKASEFKLKVYV